MNGMGQLGMHLFAGGMADRPFLVPHMPQYAFCDDRSIMVYAFGLLMFLFIMALSCSSESSDKSRKNQDAGIHHLTGNY